MHYVNTNTKPDYYKMNHTDAVIFVLRLSGCRISEILDARGRDIIQDSTLIIHGKKKSASKVVRLPELREIFTTAKRMPDEKIFRVSYHTIYREMKRRGISFTPRGNKNKAVTHSLRYEFITRLSDVTEDMRTVADCVGHRASSTSERYNSKGK